MRGKPRLAHLIASRARIIPARAGQTWPCTRARTSRPDHPRACGANDYDKDAPIVRTGSSPRVRGKLERQQLADGTERIIPARAGQTWTRVRYGIRTPDHPRACGANVDVSFAVIWCAGSSPRVRGKPRAKTCRRLEGRIIPARAGQTLTRPSDGVEGTDHPRACGANSAVFLILSMEAGSSPRVRGKRSCG